MLTLSGTLTTIAAGAPEPGSIFLQLHGYGSQIPRVSGSGVFARVNVPKIQVNPATGAFSVPLQPNDAITPSGTYYTVKVLDSNGNITQINAYQFTGAQGAVDLSSALPFDPTGTAVAPLRVTSQLVTVAYAPNPVLDGTQGTTFEMALAGNVNLLSLPNPVPGNLYILILVQDAVGGRTVTYGVNFHGASAPDPLPNGITIQCFVALADGVTLDAIGPAGYV